MHFACQHPFLDWIRQNDRLTLSEGARTLAIPGEKFWDPDFLKTVPGAVIADDRQGAPADNLFWATNLGEVGQVIEAYQSLWLPADLLLPTRRWLLVDAIVGAASAWPVSLHFNKGLAGGSKLALERTAQTATHPAARDAFALLICAADAHPAWPGIPGHEPDVDRGRKNVQLVRTAMEPLRHVVPAGGSYIYEGDYFEPEWKGAFWGDNYPRLAAIKRAYDPGNLFRGHFCVEPA